MDVYLICDESGAKGYSDVSEAYPGETGVFAGYLINGNHLPKFRKHINQIASKYFSATTKYHITELSDEKKEDLRNEVFDAIKQNNLVCVYEAIHVEGFKAEHDRIISIKNSHVKERRSDIKVSNNIKSDSLHGILFQGLFAKAIAYCLDTFNSGYKLTILIDRVDRPVYQCIKNAAKELTDFSPSETKVTGWDPHSQQVVKGKIEVVMDIPASYGMSDIADTLFEMSMDESNSPLMLGADILANSINYVFKSRNQEDIGKPLNDKYSVHTHQLYQQFYGLWEDKDSAWTTDAIYMHPLECNRIR